MSERLSAQADRAWNEDRYDEGMEDTLLTYSFTVQGQDLDALFTKAWEHACILLGDSLRLAHFTGFDIEDVLIAMGGEPKLYEARVTVQQTASVPEPALLFS
jgi:hypothetical protein